MWNDERLEPVSGKLRMAIETVARQELGRFGLKRVELDPTLDHDGDPAVVITYVFGKNGEPLDIAVAAKMIHKARDVFRDHGENRYPVDRLDYSNRRPFVYGGRTWGR